MQQTGSKKKKREILDENPFESVKGIASDVVGGMADSAFSQIFGKMEEPGTIKPNEEIKFDNLPQERLRHEEIHGFQKQRESLEQNVFSYKESVELKRTIEELVKQIKMLAKSTQSLSQEVSIAAMEEMPVNPGKYHVNFFEWLIGMIKSLRERVDESRSWLSVFQSKKKQKGYWNMFKKHGTSFGLSNERVVSTQTG